MEDLLNIVLKAHGGLKRWSQISSIEAEIALDGALWHFKGQPELFRKIQVELSTREQRLVIKNVGGSEHRSIFMPEQVRIEADDGSVLHAFDRLRREFASHTQETQWKEEHAIYFNSYALWNYLNAPFFYTWPGFVTEEIAPRVENGETWRGLKITFPEGFAAHCRQQTSWYGPDGLLRRHDYEVDILGGATGANYALAYREVDGIMVPTQRRVYPLSGDGQKVPEPLLVSIDINAISFR